MGFTLFLGYLGYLGASELGITSEFLRLLCALIGIYIGLYIGKMALEKEDQR
jgi:hypothetical protein